jgi:hypothetical protein
MNHYANIDPMQSQGQDKCLSMYLNSTYVSLPYSLAKNTSSLQMIKERQGSITNREIQVMHAYQ